MPWAQCLQSIPFKISISSQPSSGCMRNGWWWSFVFVQSCLEFTALCKWFIAVVNNWCLWKWIPVNNTFRPRPSFQPHGGNMYLMGKLVWLLYVLIYVLKCSACMAAGGSAFSNGQSVGWVEVQELYKWMAHSTSVRTARWVSLWGGTRTVGCCRWIWFPPAPAGANNFSSIDRNWMLSTDIRPGLLVTVVELAAPL